jgi:hypothetical protein
MRRGAPAGGPAGDRWAVRVMAVWHPPDPYEPTSELYRLMPPRRPVDDEQVVLVSPDLPRWRDLATRAYSASRPTIRWIWGIVGGVLTGVLVALISAYLMSR